MSSDIYTLCPRVYTHAHTHAFFPRLPAAAKKGLQGDRQLGREVSPGRHVLQPGFVRQPPRAGGQGVKRFRRWGLGQGRRPRSQRSQPGGELLSFTDDGVQRALLTIGRSLSLATIG